MISWEETRKNKRLLDSISKEKEGGKNDWERQIIFKASWGTWLRGDGASIGFKPIVLF